MQNYKIAFYTEAGTKRGMGHLVRSYAFRTYLERLNYDVRFYLDSDMNYGDKFDTISFSWNSFYVEVEYDVVVIDSYIASLDNYQEAFDNSRLLICIDDYRRLEYPDGSVVINFAPDAKVIYYRDKQNLSNYLLGIKYLFLRDSIVNAEIIKKEHIFIMFGGNDMENLSLKVLESLDCIDVPKVLATADENIYKILKNRYKNTKIIYRADDNILASCMANSLLAITTASMSVYELGYFKVPVIIIPISLNQEKGVKQFLDYNLAIKSLRVEQIDAELSDAVKKIVLKKYIPNTQIDSNGLKRVCCYMAKRLGK